MKEFSMLKIVSNIQIEKWSWFFLLLDDVPLLGVVCNYTHSLKKTLEATDKCELKPVNPSESETCIKPVER